MKKQDPFKDSIKTFCKSHDISHTKKRFSNNDNFITISIKNHSETGIDIECFKIIDFIFNIIGPTETKFRQNTFMFPNSQKIDKVNITFEKKEYKNLIKTLFNEDM